MKCDCCGYESDNKEEFLKDKEGNILCMKYCLVEG